MNYDERPATRGDLKLLEQRIAYRITALGAIMICAIVILYLVLKW
jgi:hypothetical protein